MGHVLSAARKSRRSVISFCNTALAAKFGFGPCGSRVSKPLLHLLLLFFRTAGLRAVKPSQNPCADGASSFWQGVMWATKVVRLGYRWKMGNGKRIRFWEDLWLGSIQFWKLYCIVNKKCMIIVELWDEAELRCTFRRCLDHRLMRLWDELISIAETIVFSGEEDELVWQFHSSGVYSLQSMYVVLNYSGVTPVFTFAVWNLRVLPRIHFFLWLMSKNKILTRDNLEKRRRVEDLTCLFCAERIYSSSAIRLCGGSVGMDCPCCKSLIVIIMLIMNLWRLGGYVIRSSASSMCLLRPYVEGFEN
jgi:hypothetical protein